MRMRVPENHSFVDNCRLTPRETIFEIDKIDWKAVSDVLTAKGEDPMLLLDLNLNYVI